MCLTEGAIRDKIGIVNKIEGVKCVFFERHTHKDVELPVYYTRQTYLKSSLKYELHWHETFEWIYMVEGEVEILINDASRLYCAGDLIVIPPQLPHRFGFTGKNCSYYCMIPDNSILDSGNIEFPSFSDDHLVKNRAIVDAFLSIMEEYKTKGRYHKQIIRANIVLMTALYCRDCGIEASKTPHREDNNALRITKEALLYMEEHYAEEFSGEALAARLGFSRSYLCHVIRKVTGQSLTENLLYIRCRKAREMLRQGRTVGEVVYASGFQNASYFSRTYKRMMGVSPSAHYRK